MKTQVKASVKSIEFVSKLTGKMLPKSTHWEEVFNIIMEGYLLEIYTKAQRYGDTTTIKLFKEPAEKTDLIENWEIPNADAYDQKLCDWDWNLIYKISTEYLMKNWKKLHKPVKKSKKK